MSLHAVDVFGINTDLKEGSYIDRANLDSKFNRYLIRNSHITIYGSSKCGKSWFRQKNLPDAIVVQCRYGMTVQDIYTNALASLGIKLVFEESKTSKIQGSIEATGELGASIIAKLKVKAQSLFSQDSNTKSKPVGKDISDLSHIAEILIASEKRLIIEDFHYIKESERKSFAFDLKSLWDYRCYVVIVGVWSQSGYLTTLNPDLLSRINELSIVWSNEDLKAVIVKGCKALNIEISEEVSQHLIENSYGNVGILQKLLDNLLEIAEVYEYCVHKKVINSLDDYLEAANEYAESLRSYYEKFATVVSAGIRKRETATEIYAHALAVILESEDEMLNKGVSLDYIYRISHERQTRIIKPNLESALKKIEELQVDEDNRGLVLSYNENTKEVVVIDRQLLFYRKHKPADWPWQSMIDEINESRTSKFSKLID